MTTPLEYSVEPNLPFGLRRSEPGGSWAIQQEQWATAGQSWTQTVRPSRTMHADFLRAQEIDMAALKLPLSPALKDLQMLREEEEATDEPITHIAYSRAHKVLEYLDVVLGRDFPPPHLAPDGMGGIRMEWFQGDANIRVVIPPTEEPRPYMYRLLNGASEIKKLSTALLFLTIRNHIMAR